jgi:predicted TIM-barrel fold metal-dependent hydrolase
MNSLNRMATLLSVVALTGCHCPSSAPVAARQSYRKIDVHTHFAPEAVSHVMQLMDQYGIDVVVNLSGEFPGGGLEEQLQAAAKSGGRIIVFANLDWEEALKGPGYGDRMAEQLQHARDLGARGLKIPKGFGLAYDDWSGALIRVDEPALDVVFERAGTLQMPVAIHTGDPVAFWQPIAPKNERYAELVAHPDWSNYGIPAPSWEELFAALERRVARHPKTTFISVHFGNAAEYPDRVASLLEKYPNLYIDTAARIPEMGRHPAAEMRRIFTRYAGRILFGTDLGVGTQPRQLILGSIGTSLPTPADAEHFFSSTWRYFETSDQRFNHPTPIQGNWKIDGLGLPPEVLKKIYADNAAKLLRLR